jgi:hypothetical protein
MVRSANLFIPSIILSIFLVHGQANAAPLHTSVIIFETLRFLLSYPSVPNVKNKRLQENIKKLSKQIASQEAKLKKVTEDLENRGQENSRRLLKKQKTLIKSIKSLKGKLAKAEHALEKAGTVPANSPKLTTPSVQDNPFPPQPSNPTPLELVNPPEAPEPDPPAPAPSISEPNFLQANPTDPPENTEPEVPSQIDDVSSNEPTTPSASSGIREIIVPPEMPLVSAPPQNSGQSTSSNQDDVSVNDGISPKVTAPPLEYSNNIFPTAPNMGNKPIDDIVPAESNQKGQQAGNSIGNKLSMLNILTPGITISGLFQQDIASKDGLPRSSTVQPSIDTRERTFLFKPEQQGCANSPASKSVNFNVPLRLYNLHEDVEKIKVFCRVLTPSDIYNLGCAEFNVPNHRNIKTFANIGIVASGQKLPTGQDELRRYFSRYSCWVMAVPRQENKAQLTDRPMLHASDPRCSHLGNRWRCSKPNTLFRPHIAGKITEAGIAPIHPN